MKLKKLAALLLAILLLAACGKQTPPAPAETPTPTPEPEEPPVKLLTVMLGEEADTLDPQCAVGETAFEVLAACGEGLTRQENGQTVAGLAESWSLSEDGRVYTFTLRDASWSDGEPITAADFVYGWQRALDPEVGSPYPWLLMDVASMKNAEAVHIGKKEPSALGAEATDDKTLKVTLDEPMPGFLGLLSHPAFYPVRQSFAEGLPEGSFGNTVEGILCCGPFRLKEWNPADKSLLLEKNPLYYAADEVALDELCLRVMPDSRQAGLAYQEAHVDVISLYGAQVQQVESSAELVQAPGAGLWYLTLNQKEPALADENFRMALACAVNRAALAGEEETPAFGLLPAAVAEGTFAEDTAKAGECYTAAKEKLKAEEFTLELLCDEDSAPKAELLKGQLEGALPGLTITLNTVPRKQRVLAAQEGSFQLCLADYRAEYADPMAVLALWKSNSPQNYGRWKSKDYDALLKAGDYAAAEAMLAEETVAIPLTCGVRNYLVKAEVSGIGCDPFTGVRSYRSAEKK